MKQATLLDKLLRLLDSGGIHSTADLARQLDVGEGLLAAMADDLVRHGYLASLTDNCGTGCNSCWAAAVCTGSGNALPVLALTAKGREALEKAAR